MDNTMVNRIEVQGKVVGIGKDPMGHDTITILVVRPKGRPSQRTATAPTWEKEKSFVRVALKDPLEIEVRHNDHVKASGFTNAYSYRGDEEDKWKYVQYFVADTFGLQETKLKEAFDVDGRFYDASYFKGFFYGEVMHVIRPKNSPFARIIVRTPETPHQRASTIRFTYLTGGRLPKLEQFERGDKVCIVAGITTPQREVDGKLRSLESLYVEDIALVEKQNGQVPKNTKAPQIEEEEPEEEVVMTEPEIAEILEDDPALIAE